MIFSIKHKFFALSNILWINLIIFFINLFNNLVYNMLLTYNIFKNFKNCYEKIKNYWWRIMCLYTIFSCISEKAKAGI